MSDLKDALAVLELPPRTTRSEVRNAYRKLLKVWHPDRFTGDPELQAEAAERTKKINAAYATLMDYLKSKRQGPTQSGSSAEDPRRRAAEEEQQREREASWKREQERRSHHEHTEKDGRASETGQRKGQTRQGRSEGFSDTQGVTLEDLIPLSILKSTLAGGFKATDTPDVYLIKIYTGGFSGAKTARKKAVKKVEDFVTTTPGYTSYEIIKSRRNFLPFSYYEYTVRFKPRTNRALESSDFDV